MDICLIADTVQAVSPDAAHAVLASEIGVVWVDVRHDEDDGMAMLVSVIDAMPGDVADCHLRLPVPKLHAYQDHYFSAINGLARGTDGRLYFQPLKIFFNARLLVTVLGPTSAALAPGAAHRDLTAIRDRVDRLELRPTSAFELVAAVRLEMLNAHQALVAAAAAQVAQIETTVRLGDPVEAESMLEGLFELRHELQTIRTNAAQTHELYVHLIELLGSQDELMHLDMRRLNDLRLGFGHLRNTVDLEREYLQEVLDLLQTRVSTELNRFVRKITAWGTIGIAWTVIVGIYGMNFTAIPGLEWRFGFVAVLGFMAVIGLVLGVMFRRRRWL